MLREPRGEACIGTCSSFEFTPISTVLDDPTASGAYIPSPSPSASPRSSPIPSSSAAASRIPVSLDAADNASDPAQLGQQRAEEQERELRETEALAAARRKLRDGIITRSEFYQVQRAHEKREALLQSEGDVPSSEVQAATGETSQQRWNKLRLLRIQKRVV